MLAASAGESMTYPAEQKPFFRALGGALLLLLSGCTATEFNNNQGYATIVAVQSFDWSSASGTLKNSDGTPLSDGDATADTEAIIELLNVPSLAAVAFYSTADCSGTPLLQTTSSDDGTLRTRLDLSAVPDGALTLYAGFEVDGADQRCGTTGISVVIDRTAPAAPSGLALQSPGSSPSNNTTPTVRVSGVVAGDTVSLYTNSQCASVSLKASGTVADEATTIDLVSSALTDGTHTFYAKATDPAGNDSACSATNVSYSLDATPPALTGLANDSTPANTKAWSWGCSEAGCTYRYSIDSSSSGTLGGAYSATTSASQTTGTGTYYLHVQALDAVGNPSTVVTVSAVLDNTAPSAPSGLARHSPTNATGKTTTPTIRVSGVVNGDTITLYTNSGCTAPSLVATGTAAGTTLDLATSALTDGSYTLYAKSTDPAMNASSCSTANVSYTLDRTAPSGLALDTPATSPGNDNTPTISIGGVASGDVVSIYTSNTCALAALKGYATASGTSVNVTVSSALADGSYTFYAQSKDDAGNASACSTDNVSYTVDTTAPSAPSFLLVGNGGTSNDTTPALSAASVESGATVSIYSDASCSTLLDSESESGGAIDFENNIDLSSLGAVTQTITFRYRISDPVGNTTACATTGKSYTLDTQVTVPTFSSSPSFGIATNNTTPTFTVSGGEASSTFDGYVANSSCSGAPDITITLNGSGGGTVPVDPLSSSGGNPDTLSFYFKVTDPSGNASSCQGPYNYILDADVPSVNGLTDDATPTKSKTWTWSCSESPCTYDYVINTTSNTNPSGAFGATTTASQSSGTGTYYLHVRAKDAVGNISAVVHVSAVIDNTAPSVTGLSNDTSPTKSKTWSWGCNEASCTYDYVIDTTSNTDPSGSYGATATDSQASGDGTYYIHVQAKDAAGNESAVVHVSAVLDNTSPSVTGISDDATVTKSKTWTWGCSEASCTYDYVIDTTSNTDPSGSYGATATGSQTSGDGTYYIHVQAKDAAGNESAVTHGSVVIDNTAPTVPTEVGLWDPNTTPNNDSTPQLIVNAVSVFGNTTRVYTDSACSGSVLTSSVSGGSPQYITLPSLADGSYDFYVTATDPAGNTSSCSSAHAAYTLDTVAPSAPTSLSLVSPASSPGTSATPTIRVGGVVNGDAIALFSTSDCTGAPLATGTAGGTTIDLTSSALAAGSYTFYAAAKDTAGNSSACSTANVAYELLSSLNSSWTFDFANSGTNYTLSNASSTYIGSNGSGQEVAKLVASDQIDDDNMASGFGGGTQSGGTLWDATNSWIRLGTASSLQDLDVAWAPAFSNLKGYWKLNDAGGSSTAADSAGSNAGTATNVTFNVAGAVNKAASFNGTNSVITLSDSALLSPGTGNQTIALWFMTTTTPGANAYLYYDGGTSGAYVGLYVRPDGKLEAKILDDSANTATLTSALTVTDGNWYHAVVIRSGTGIKWYVNGVGPGSNGTTLGTVTTSNAPVPAIGSDATGTANPFNGTIDDVAIWNTELTKEAIFTLFRHQRSKYSGTFTSRVMDGWSAGQSWTSLAWTPTRPYMKALPDSGSNESNTNYTALETNTLQSSIAGLWHLDETSGNVANVSGQGTASATPANSPMLGNPSVLGAGVRFKGAGDSIPIGAGTDSVYNFDGTNSFSISLWFTLNSSPTANYRRVIGRETADGKGWYLGYHSTDGFVFVRGDSGGVFERIASGVIPSNGKTYHLAAVYNGSTMYLYVNGKLIQSTGSSRSIETTTQTMALGMGSWAGAANTTGAVGTVDEVAVWSRALGDGANNGASNEIQSLYRRGGNRIVYQIRSCSDSSCTAGSPGWKGPDGTDSSYFSELYNTTSNNSGNATLSGLPTMTFSNFAPLGLSTNRYFQYRAILESDDANNLCDYGSGATACMPEIKSVSVAPVHYDSNSPTVITTNGISFYSLTSAVETLGSNGCTSGLGYNLALANTGPWKYWDGAAWQNSDGTPAQSNSVATLNTAGVISTFGSAVGNGSVFLKAFLKSSGTSTCELDQFALAGWRHAPSSLTQTFHITMPGASNGSTVFVAISPTSGSNVFGSGDKIVCSTFTISNTSTTQDVTCTFSGASAGTPYYLAIDVGSMPIVYMYRMGGGDPTYSFTQSGTTNINVQ